MGTQRAGHEVLLVLGKHHPCNVASKTPTPHTDTSPVNVLDLVHQFPDDVQGVGCLVAPQLPVYSVFESAPLITGSPHVNVGHDEVPLAGEVGVPARRPLAGHSLGAGASVSEKYPLDKFIFCAENVF